jgi:general secretion pathway protein F
VPVFNYRGVTENNEKTRGSVEAIDRPHALQLLSARGFNVYELTSTITVNKDNLSEQATASDSVFSKFGLTQGRRDVSSDELRLCVHELATLINAGISLADAVLNIARGHAGRPLGYALDATYASLRSGSRFAQSLINSGIRLPDYVSELLRAGEETGKLGEALTSASLQLEADAQFRRESRNALTYPMVLIVSGLLATLIVFIFVVPKFGNILTNPKADIPVFSRWVLESGLWLVQNKLIAALVAASTIAGVGFMLAQASVRAQLWEIASVLPLAKRWVEHVELSRWASMLSVLLVHHVPLLDAMKHAANCLRGQSLRRKAQMIINDVKGGQPLAAAMQAHQYIDAVGLNLIRVGEQSGKLAETSGSLAKLHRNQAEQNMKQFLVLLEPVTILLVSVLLGGIMISVMLAITSLTNVI